MRTSKILVVGLPLVLAGCHDFFGEDSDSFYTPPPPPAAAPAPMAAAKPTPPAHEGCGCPDKPTPVPSAAVTQPAAVTDVPSQDSAWFPSEGHLVYGGDLVMELKRSKHGINPSHEEMAQYLHTNMKRFPGMGVTAAQAEKILEELGL